MPQLIMIIQLDCKEHNASSSAGPWALKENKHADSAIISMMSSF